jgi:hypothetical protein
MREIVRDDAGDVLLDADFHERRHGYFEVGRGQTPQLVVMAISVKVDQFGHSVVSVQ